MTAEKEQYMPPSEQPEETQSDDILSRFPYMRNHSVPYPAATLHQNPQSSSTFSFSFFSEETDDRTPEAIHQINTVVFPIETFHKMLTALDEIYKRLQSASHFQNDLTQNLLEDKPEVEKLVKTLATKSNRSFYDKGAALVVVQLYQMQHPESNSLSVSVEQKEEKNALLTIIRRFLNQELTVSPQDPSRIVLKDRKMLETAYHKALAVFFLLRYVKYSGRTINTEQTPSIITKIQGLLGGDGSPTYHSLLQSLKDFALRRLQAEKIKADHTHSSSSFLSSSSSSSTLPQHSSNSNPYAPLPAALPPAEEKTHPDDLSSDDILSTSQGTFCFNDILTQKGYRIGVYKETFHPIKLALEKEKFPIDTLSKMLFSLKEMFEKKNVLKTEVLTKSASNALQIGLSIIIHELTQYITRESNAPSDKDVLSEHDENSVSKTIWHFFDDILWSSKNDKTRTIENFMSRVNKQNGDALYYRALALFFLIKYGTNRYIGNIEILFKRHNLDPDNSIFKLLKSFSDKRKDEVDANKAQSKKKHTPIGSSPDSLPASVAGPSSSEGTSYPPFNHLLPPLIRGGIPGLPPPLFLGGSPSSQYPNSLGHPDLSCPDSPPPLINFSSSNHPNNVGSPYSYESPGNVPVLRGSASDSSSKRFAQSPGDEESPPSPPHSPDTNMREAGLTLCCLKSSFPQRLG